jgi:hypothetical protein
MAFKHHSTGGRLRKGLALFTALCIAFAMVPAAWADSVGSTPSAVTDSTTKSFVKLSKDVEIFTDDTKPASGTITVTNGTVLMLVSTSTYTVTDGTTSTEYGCLYYNNKRYNVVWADVSGDVMTASAVTTYVTGTLWTVTSYPSLKREYNLIGNVQVYALQVALSTLNYYSDALDGEYGLKTQAAVKSFQRAYSLTVDGYAGPLKLKVLYPLALAAYSGTARRAAPPRQQRECDDNVNLTAHVLLHQERAPAGGAFRHFPFLHQNLHHRRRHLVLRGLQQQLRLADGHLRKRGQQLVLVLLEHRHAQDHRQRQPAQIL